MIRFKNEVFEDYKICPITAQVFKILTGEVLKQMQKNRRPYVRINHHQLFVHRIMANTYLGYEKLDVHHIDDNKQNNCLLNLQYLDRATHSSITNTGRKFSEYGIHLSDEAKAKISASKRGKHLSEEHKEAIRSALIGKQFSEERNKKISTALTGHKCSDATKIKISATKNGRHWWNDGNKSVMTYECPRRRMDTWTFEE